MEENLTKQFREAIQKKLLEYDAFHDEELSQYIMVMVANKKSKESMENDLSLFLGKNTSKFTSWLHDMIDRIETSPKDDAMIIEPVLSMEGSKAMLLNKEDDDDDNILALDSQEPGDDLLIEELQEEFICSSEPGGKKSVEIEGITKTHKKEQEVKRICNVSREIDEAKELNLPKKQFSCKSTVTSLKRPSTVLDEYDPMNPSVKSVASIVNAKERKSSVPISLQANKLLLFKAMEDANKSVLGKNIDEMYKPTPIKTLNSIKEHFPKLQGPLNRFSCDSDNHLARKRFARESIRNLPMHKLELENVHKYLLNESLSYNPEPLHHIVEPLPISDMEFGNSSMFNLSNFDETSESRSASPPTCTPIRPHFVVTLDGLDLNSFRDKRLIDAFSESMDTDEVDIQHEDYSETEIEEIFEETSLEAEKASDKCRYWPLCKKGDNCIYHHPKFPCKSFPNCSFGEKCHFIHPDCKFDSLCSRKDCPYTHKNKKDAIIPNITPPKKHYLPMFSQKTIPCKYFPNCSSRNCPYTHPKKCRFGLKCKAPKCPFLHPTFPSRSQLKWKSVSSF